MFSALPSVKIYRYAVLVQSESTLFIQFHLEDAVNWSPAIAPAAAAAAVSVWSLFQLVN